jgi:hypothetical protein
VKAVHIAVAIVAIALFTAAALYGAWIWWRGRRSVWFWRVLRAAQVVLVVQAAIGGVLALSGHKPHSLHVLYGVLPLLVSFIAETFRVNTAQMVLDARGYESSADVGKQPPEEQRAVVLAIVRREIGVMALAAAVIVILLARAAATG